MTTSVAEKRPLGALGRLGLVAGLHLGLLYLIATSLGMVPSLISEPEPITLQPQEPAPPAEPAKSIPRPHLDNPVVHLPEPEPLPTDPDNTNQVTTKISEDPNILPPVAPPTHQVQLVGVRVDSRYPLTQPVYPSSDIRQGNEGTAEIEVYVLPSGRIGDARIVKSAGSPTLDQSAIDEARRRWRLLPAMRDGEPYAQWHRLKVTFNLRNR